MIEANIFSWWCKSKYSKWASQSKQICDGCWGWFFHFLYSKHVFWYYL